ncbi:hypothetical protein BGZ94_002703, partial [Podila epigama]
MSSGPSACTRFGLSHRDWFLGVPENAYPVQAREGVWETSAHEDDGPEEMARFLQNQRLAHAYKFDPTRATG